MITMVWSAQHRELRAIAPVLPPGQWSCSLALTNTSSVQPRGVDVYFTDQRRTEWRRNELGILVRPEHPPFLVPEAGSWQEQMMRMVGQAIGEPKIQSIRLTRVD
jgi:hypothetical protein